MNEVFRALLLHQLVILAFVNDLIFFSILEQTTTWINQNWPIPLLN